MEACSLQDPYVLSGVFGRARCSSSLGEEVDDLAASWELDNLCVCNSLTAIGSLSLIGLCSVQHPYRYRFPVCRVRVHAHGR